jgi:hypothetical protein
MTSTQLIPDELANALAMLRGGTVERSRRALEASPHDE